MVFKRRLGRFARLSWRERGLLFETFTLLGLGRFLVVMVPFRNVAPNLGVLNGQPSSELKDDDLEKVKLISYWVRFTARHTPFTSNCFNKALAAHFMLRRRGIANTLYLGVAKDGQEMEAHAWLRSGEQMVTGAAGYERFTEVSHFSWQP
jgi:hypothetical protein